MRIVKAAICENDDDRTVAEAVYRAAGNEVYAVPVQATEITIDRFKGVGSQRQLMSDLPVTARFLVVAWPRS